MGGVGGNGERRSGRNHPELPTRPTLGRFTDGQPSQQTAELAGSVNAMRRKRFVWRPASFICILAHKIPELRGGDEPAAHIDFFSAVRHDPHVDLFGDPDGLSQ